MDEIPDMAAPRNSLDAQRLEDLQDFSRCFQLINAIEQRLMLIRDLQPDTPAAPTYWVRARPEIERLASSEAVARKAYHSAVRAGFGADPTTVDLFSLLRDALTTIASSLGHALAICAAAQARLGNSVEALRDQSTRQQEDRSS